MGKQTEFMRRMLDVVDAAERPTDGRHPVLVGVFLLPLGDNKFRVRFIWDGPNTETVIEEMTMDYDPTLAPMSLEDAAHSWLCYMGHSGDVAISGVRQFAAGDALHGTMGPDGNIREEPVIMEPVIFGDQNLDN